MPDRSRFYFLATHQPYFDTGLVEEEFSLITVERLREPGYWDRLYATVLWMDEVHEVGLAQKLAARLEKLLQPSPDRITLSTEYHERLSQLITLTKIVALPTLKPRDLEEVCRSGVVLALRAGLDLHAGIQHAFMFTGEPELAVPLAQTIMRVLGTNGEIIGDSPIVDPETGERMPSTVANWLRQYNGAFPVDAERGPVERAQYLHRDGNVKQLPPADRELLVKLLELYDLLRFPHKAPIEEGAGELAVERRKAFAGAVSQPARVSTGGKVPASAEAFEAPSEPDAAILRSALRGSPTFDLAVASAADRLQALAGRSSVKLRAAFQEAVERQDAPVAVAALATLVTTGVLPGQLRDDATLRQQLRTAFAQYFGPTAVAAFSTNPTARQSVRLFIQYVLQERLGMPEGDAARIGVQLGNLFRQHGHPELGALAYYDVAEQRFKWLE